jgi:hypothetical protein
MPGVQQRFASAAGSTVLAGAQHSAPSKAPMLMQLSRLSQQGIATVGSQ